MTSLNCSPVPESESLALFCSPCWRCAFPCAIDAGTCPQCSAELEEELDLGQPQPPCCQHCGALPLAGRSVCERCAPWLATEPRSVCSGPWPGRGPCSCPACAEFVAWLDAAPPCEPSPEDFLEYQLRLGRAILGTELAHVS